MSPTHPRLPSAALLLVLAVLLCTAAACNIFEPREPESPSQSSSRFLPPTDPSIVLDNLEGSVDERNTLNYTRCFADPSRTSSDLIFIPSQSAGARYAALFANWGASEERVYFENLVASAARRPNANSGLRLTNRRFTRSADSATYTCDYEFVFEHNEKGFPTTARGNAQFTLGTSGSNSQEWVIYRWTDFGTSGTDTTWSDFKGRFSN